MEIIKIMREKLMDRETQTTSFQMLVWWRMVVMVEGEVMGGGLRFLCCWRKRNEGEVIILIYLFI